MSARAAAWHLPSSSLACLFKVVVLAADLASWESCCFRGQGPALICAVSSLAPARNVEDLRHLLLGGHRVRAHRAHRALWALGAPPHCPAHVSCSSQGSSEEHQDRLQAELEGDLVAAVERDLHASRSSELRWLISSLTGCSYRNYT